MVVSGSLTDGVLAHAILIFSTPIDTAHQLKEGEGFPKKVRKQATEKPFTSKGKKGDVGMAKCFSLDGTLVIDSGFLIEFID